MNLPQMKYADNIKRAAQNAFGGYNHNAYAGDGDGNTCTGGILIMTYTHKTENIMRRLIIIALLLSLGDAICTAIGVSMGVISEGNPIWRSFMHAQPLLAALAALACTSGLLAVVYKFGIRCRCTLPLLAGLCVVKSTVMGMHIDWISQVL